MCGGESLIDLNILFLEMWLVAVEGIRLLLTSALFNIPRYSLHLKDECKNLYHD